MPLLVSPPGKLGDPGSRTARIAALEAELSALKAEQQAERSGANQVASSSSSSEFVPRARNANTGPLSSARADKPWLQSRAKARAAAAAQKAEPDVEICVGPPLKPIQKIRMFVERAGLSQVPGITKHLNSLNVPDIATLSDSDWEQILTGIVDPNPAMMKRVALAIREMRAQHHVAAPPPPAAVATVQDKAESVAFSFDAADWNAQTAEDPTPLEMRGLPEYEGSESLVEALLCHGLPGLAVADIRALSRTSTTQRKTMEDDEVWRLQCAALAKQSGLYAPASTCSWRQLFLETLWPARGKWRGEVAAEAAGFRIRVAVRVRPRKGDGSRHDGLVLPLHQRLRMLKKGQKLGSLEDEKGGASQEQLAEALKDQGDLSPELLQALLEAQQMQAVMGQAETQARGGPKYDASVEEDAAGAGAAGADAASEATALTAEDHKSLKEAEDNVNKNEAIKKAEKEREDKENEEEQMKKEVKGSKLLLVQPSRVVMFVPGSGVRPFLFSTVCDGQTSQVDFYQRVAQDAVCSALNGMNACVLAYGQTGSGKTHSVFGPPGTIDDACAAAERAANRRMRATSADGLASKTELPPNAGLVLRACDELLACAERPGVACDSMSLSAQYIQIYDESLTDLLSGGAVMLRELGEYAEGAQAAQGGTVLQGATHVKLQTTTDALALLRAGELHKRVAATAMNNTSSRAHTVFLLSLTQRGGEAEGEEKIITSQLALVDLAGCEQIKQSKVVGQRLKEAVGINSSLLALGKCITALSEGRRHVPYAEAKLTRLLRGAFGGSSRTTCVIAASPDDAHGENTVQALRFGERCATITNAGRVAAVSATQALAVVDEALATCEQSMAALEAKERTSLPAYATLKARHASLAMRRQQLSAA